MEEEIQEKRRKKRQVRKGNGKALRTPRRQVNQTVEDTSSGESGEEEDGPIGQSGVLWKEEVEEWDKSLVKALGSNIEGSTPGERTRDTRRSLGLSRGGRSVRGGGFHGKLLWR